MPEDLNKRPGPRAIGRKARVALYCNLRMRGKTKAQSAMELGISIPTAITYEREWMEIVERNKREDVSRSAQGVISKDALAVRLSIAIASEGTPVQYLSALSRALAELQGYNAPAKMDIRDSRPVTPIKDLLDQWRAEREERTGGAPQAASEISSSGVSRAATDLEKGSPQPLENKGTYVEGEEQANKLETAITKSSIINNLQNQNSDGKSPGRS